MKTFKQMMLRIFFVMEVCIFVGVYFFGPRGIRSQNELEQQNSELRVEIGALQEEVASWKTEIDIWQSDDFYKEKIARERLQMARPSDKIFYVR